MLHTLGNHRAYGVALLVVGLSLPAFADFTSIDSQNLQTIRYVLGSNYSSTIQDLLSLQSPVLNSIDSKLSPVSTISSDVSIIKQYLDYNLNGDTATDSMSVHDFIVQFNQKFFQGVDRFGTAVEDNPATVSVFSSNGYSPFLEPGSSFNNIRTAQMAVTNVAETFWLEKIYNAIQYNGGSGGYSVNTPEGVLVYPDYDSAYYSIVEKLLSGTEDDYANLFQFFSYGQSLSFMYLSLLDWLALPDNLRDPLTEYESHVLTYDIHTWGLDFLDSVGQSFNYLYGNQRVLDLSSLSGIDSDSFNPTNFFTADGSIENTDNAFTNSETSVFSKFATSFLPSGLFNPDEVNTNLFEYVDSDISETPSFNPANISGNGGLRSFSSSSSSFDYDFDDSSGDYDYNLINPLKTATDSVQHDTDLDNKFDQLAGLVNQRITDIFHNPLNSISDQPARWQASLIDKDMNETEDYVDPQYSKSSDGVQFVCWVCESMMFFTFFSFCVRRSLRVQQSRDVASSI